MIHCSKKVFFGDCDDQTRDSRWNQWRIAFRRCFRRCVHFDSIYIHEFTGILLPILVRIRSKEERVLS